MTPNAKWILTYASCGDELYLADAEVYGTWQEALDAAREKLLDNIEIDLNEPDEVRDALSEAHTELDGVAAEQPFDISVANAETLTNWEWRVAVQKVLL